MGDTVTVGRNSATCTSDGKAAHSIANHVNATNAGFNSGSVCPTARSSSASTSPVPRCSFLKSNRSWSSNCDGSRFRAPSTSKLRMCGISFSSSAISRLMRARLQIGLRAAQVAGNDRKLLRFGVRRNVSFAAIGQRTNHSVSSVVGTQHRRHRFQRADKEKISRKVVMMSSA